MEEIEKSKRIKMRKMRKEMETELIILKEKNKELFESSQSLVDELDKSLRMRDEIKEENGIL